MKRRSRTSLWLVTGLVSFFGAGVAVAVLLAAAGDAAADPTVVELEQQDGTTLQAELLGIEDDRLRVRVNGRERTLSFESLTEASVHEARAALLEPEDIRGHLALGVYAHEQSLYERASRSFMIARQGAGEVEERAGALWAQARAADARERFRRARQLEQGRQLEDALALFLEVYITFPDVEDDQLQSDLVAHIHTLQHDLGLPAELPPRVAPDGLDEEEAEALEDDPAGDDDGADAGEDGEVLFDEDLGRREEQPYNEARRLYLRIVEEIEAGEDLIREAVDEKARRAITDRRISRPLQEAYTRWENAKRTVDERMFGHLEGRDWPRLQRLVERLGPRLDALFEDVATHTLSMWVQRIEEDERNARTNAYKWVNLLLAHDPEHELARLTRRHLTEQALRDQFR